MTAGMELVLSCFHVGQTRICLFHMFVAYIRITRYYIIVNIHYLPDTHTLKDTHTEPKHTKSDITLHKDQNKLWWKEV